MIAVCTPARDTVSARFAFDLAQMMAFDKDVRFFLSEGSLLSNQRTTLVNAALSARASHILFIDSDMRFPKDTAQRLLSRAEDIVGANCKTRDGLTTTARLGAKSLPVTSGLTRVDSLGFGVTMVAAGVFTKLSSPWFLMPYDGEKIVGEDIYFCDKAVRAGFLVWADNDLGKDVRHIGAIEHGGD